MTVATSGPVGICGLGPMGGPIAERLLSAGVALTVWNRSAEKAVTFGDRGATVAATPALAAAPIVLTVLPDLAQVESVLEQDEGLLVGWRRNRVVDPVLVIHGTTSPVATAAFAARVGAEHGVVVIDAPLSGGVVGAADGTLSIMVGGEADRARQLNSIFAVYGRTIRYFGPSGNGALAKGCNQIVVAATVAAISESLSLAARAGLDRDMVMDILEGGLANSEVLRQKRSKWIDGDYREGGSARNQLKDLQFVHDAAASFGIELSVADSVLDLFAQMVARGDGALDHTGVIRTISAGRIEEPT